MTDLRPFAFYSLPRELRDLVYGHLVIKELTAGRANELSEALRERDPGDDGEDQRCKLDVINKELELDPRSKGYGLSTSIMATSNQIHDEASAVLYGRNRFRWGIHGATLQTSSGRDSCANLDLPAKYIRHITRIHFLFQYTGDAHAPNPEPDRRTIALTIDRLRRCCVALLPNRLRDVKVTYVDFVRARRVATIINDPFCLSATLSHLALLPIPRVRQKILEPLKLLKGVEKVTFVFKDRLSPDYVLELKGAMTAPKAATSASNNMGVNEDVAEPPGYTI